MPFKGDMRLGGPHDNEANLNGSSDGPSVPSAGTVIQSGLTAPIYVWASHPVQGSIQIQTGTDTYNVVADGVGGTTNVVTSQTFVPEGTFIGPSFSPTPVTSTYDGYTFPNGKTYVSRYVSDGAGEYTIGNGVELTGSFYADGTMVTGAPQYSIVDQYAVHPNDGTSLISNGKYSYDSFVWDGSGEIYMSSGQPYTGGEFYPDGTLESDASDTNQEVPSGSGNYFFDGNDNRYEWDGAGNIVFRYSGLYTNGTFITSYGDNNYYWDGMGGYYSEYAGSGGGGSSYPTGATGNTTNGTNYIDINGNQYENGTYYGEEYHDGNGGYTWNYTYSYASYGYVFTSTDTYDEWGSPTGTTYYKSNYMGGYYTESSS